MTITEGNGRPTVVRVPVTFIPVDMTTMATKNAILMSPDFRRLVASGVLTLIGEEDAEKMLMSPQAKDEQRRLFNIEQVHAVQESQATPEMQSMQAELDGKIGGFAMNIAHTTDGDEEAVVSNLRNNIDTLSQEELRYVVNNSAFPKVKALAAEFIVR